jgi:hypothetical protein
MAADAATLRDLVARHGVNDAARPHYQIDVGQKVVVGFHLELYGTYDHGHARLNPGCPSCEQTYADLKTLAQSVLPAESCD